MFRYKPKGFWMKWLYKEKNIEIEDPKEKVSHLSKLYMKCQEEIQEDVRTAMVLT
jgi:hypothetical protein